MNEPTFTLRASDKFAVFALTTYLSEYTYDKATTPEDRQAIRNVIEEFRAWERANPGGCTLREPYQEIALNENQV